MLQKVNNKQIVKGYLNVFCIRTVRLGDFVRFYDCNHNNEVKQFHDPLEWRVDIVAPAVSAHLEAARMTHDKIRDVVQPTGVTVENHFEPDISE